MKIGDKVKNAYDLVHNDKLDEALKEFNSIYSSFDKEQLENGSDLFKNYISCLLGLGEIYMKKRDLKKSLEFYKEGYELTNGEEFNILFNLGVVYQNLGEIEKSQEILEKAKKINPKDPNLLRFIGEISEGNEDNNLEEIDEDFEEKVKKMIEEIKD